MNFLKFVSALGLALLLSFMLGNLVTYLWPPSVTGTAYETCYDQHPFPSSSDFGSNDEYVAAEEQATTARETCEKEQSQLFGDRQALAFQAALLRAVVAFMVLVVIAIVLHRRYPFLAGSLIAGGLLFLLIYPFTAQVGWLFDSLGSGATALTDVQRQVLLVEFVLQALGFAILVVADMQFFEKHSGEGRQ